MNELKKETLSLLSLLPRNVVEPRLLQLDKDGRLCAPKSLRTMIEEGVAFCVHKLHDWCLSGQPCQFWIDIHDSNLRGSSMSNMELEELMQSISLHGEMVLDVLNPFEKMTCSVGIFDVSDVQIEPSFCRFLAHFRNPSFEKNTSLTLCAIRFHVFERDPALVVPFPPSSHIFAYPEFLKPK